MASDRYPTWNVPAEAPREWLPALDVPGPEPQKRLTVLLRALILVPHYIVLFVLSIAAFFAVVAGWFAALVLGRLPDSLAGFLSSYLAYRVRVLVSLMLLHGAYPPFALTPPADFPVRIELRPGRLNRLAVFFRLILLIPAAIVQGLLGSGWWVASFVWWLITLILGRMPRALFEATAAVVRFSVRFDAYVMLLTSAYPKRLFGDRPDEARTEPALSSTRPLLLSGAGKALVVLFLVLGLASGTASGLTPTTEKDNSPTY
ncbi:DUF4389 domain-containing protein [Streptomyces mangrovisoli]|uniref:DUF4389 domain-containing protein n=1 Tax=Streptomyces mangrovisoli TaxID=1428628 RepID=A0A1J4NNM8_9ACTN|nr:DUF4389 domain-containing protein [Streptomyces mangrovisoli]OIJ63196.1 hypothetical protein WN71_035380 [Streptomyces mangrovisoli]